MFAHVSREQVAAATQRIGELARPSDDQGYYEGQLGRYSQVRRFMPALLRSIAFHGTVAGQSVLDGMRFLRELEGERAPHMQHAPLSGVSRP